MVQDIIKMYGAEWCGDCIMSKSLLDKLGINYEYIDIDVVEGAADEVIKINNGMRSIPVIIFPDGTRLVEPSNDELEKKVEHMKTL